MNYTSFFFQLIEPNYPHDFSDSLPVSVKYHYTLSKSLNLSQNVQLQCFTKTSTMLSCTAILLSFVHFQSLNYILNRYASKFARAKSSYVLCLVKKIVIKILQPKRIRVVRYTARGHWRVEVVFAALQQEGIYMQCPPIRKTNENLHAKSTCMRVYKWAQVYYTC